MHRQLPNVIILDREPNAKEKTKAKETKEKESVVKVKPIIKEKTTIIRPLQLKRKYTYAPSRGDELITNESISTNYSPSVTEIIKQRLKYVFEPLVSNTYYQDIERGEVYSPKSAFKRKGVYKPSNSYSYSSDYDYEPKYVQVTEENYSPRSKSNITFNPQVTEESYPVFGYATFGIPDTYVDQYAPEDSIKIKPVTEFEIHAKPKPIIVNQSHLYLLGKLINEVTK